MQLRALQTDLVVVALHKVLHHRDGAERRGLDFGVGGANLLGLELVSGHARDAADTGAVRGAVAVAVRQLDGLHAHGLLADRAGLRGHTIFGEVGGGHVEHQSSVVHERHRAVERRARGVQVEGQARETDTRQNEGARQQVEAIRERHGRMREP
ncbi:hypothetical protein BC828DRAFT_108411 [Blastocladiella britannica]|nr:hypothetical protein BC828DRAFT_108411 [Blastocladiella britannica]